MCRTKTTSEAVLLHPGACRHGANGRAGHRPQQYYGKSCGNLIGLLQSMQNLAAMDPLVPKRVPVLNRKVGYSGIETVIAVKILQPVVEYDE